MAAVMLRGDYAAGYRVVRRIVAVGEAHGYEPGTSQARFLSAVMACWFEPIEKAVQAGQRAREELIAGGNLASAGYAYYMTVYCMVDCAPALDGFAAEVEAGLAFARRTGNEQVGQWLGSYQWLAGVLRGEGSAAADAAVPAGGHGGNPVTLVAVHSTGAIAAAVFGDQAALARHAGALMPLLPTVEGSHPSAVARLLHGLALAGQARAADGEERASLLAETGRADRMAGRPGRGRAGQLPAPAAAARGRAGLGRWGLPRRRPGLRRRPAAGRRPAAALAPGPDQRTRRPVLPGPRPGPGRL